MKNDAKYTSDNEVWIYTVGLFGLALPKPSSNFTKTN